MDDGIIIKIVPKNQQFTTNCTSIEGNNENEHTIVLSSVLSAILSSFKIN